MSAVLSLLDPASRQEIIASHGATHVGTLRGIYGADFAEGFSDMPTLAEILSDLDDRSLDRLVADYQSGRL